MSKQNPTLSASRSRALLSLEALSTRRQSALNTARENGSLSLSPRKVAKSFRIKDKSVPVRLIEASASAADS